MHQLAVVRHQRVVPAPRVGRPTPAFVANAQRQHPPIALRRAQGRLVRHRRDGVKGAVEDRSAVARRLRLPPAVAAPQRQRGEQAGDRDPKSRAHAAAGIRLRTRRQSALADRAADDRQQSRRQKYTERGERRAEPRRHRPLRRCQREHRDDDSAVARRSIDRDGQLIRRRGHEPELRRVQRCVARNRRGGLGRRRAFQPDIPLTSADSYLVRHGIGHACDADGDLRASGNHARQAHGDAHVVGTGLAAEERVRAADVRHRQRRQCEHRSAHAPSRLPSRSSCRDRERRPGHRCTRDIQLPHHKPHRAET
jgi:hypothetical protein